MTNLSLAEKVEGLDAQTLKECTARASFLVDDLVAAWIDTEFMSASARKSLRQNTQLVKQEIKEVARAAFLRAKGEQNG